MTSHFSPTPTRPATRDDNQNAANGQLGPLAPPTLSETEREANLDAGWLPPTPSTPWMANPRWIDRLEALQLARLSHSLNNQRKDPAP